MRKSRFRFQDESGQSLVLFAFGFSIMLAFLALAVDVGMLFQAKRKLQIAADAAAIAAAQDYLFNQSTTTAKLVGKTASSANGYTDASGGVTVTMSVPPADGADAGANGDVEAVVSAPVNTFFMGLMGTNSMTLKARAVAGAPTNGSACIWLMNPNGVDLRLQGAYDIEAPACGIYANSTTSSAVSVTGGGGTVNAAYLDAVGNSVPGHMTSPTPVTPNAQPRTSPWGNLVGANPSTGTGCTTTVTTSNLTLTGNIAGPGPGNVTCYTKAVTLSNVTIGTGSFGATPSQDVITTGAGTLAFGSGVSISGTVKIYGGTIDIQSGTFNQPSNSLLSIVAPTSGTYNAIAIMQPATNTNQVQVQFGSNNQVLDGYIYAPGAEVYLQDNGGGVTATGIVAFDLYIKASSVRIPNYDNAHPTTSPNRVLAMLE
jgi:Flp pilus assembly protein TadG